MTTNTIEARLERIDFSLQEEYEWLNRFEARGEAGMAAATKRRIAGLKAARTRTLRGYVR